ncbi:MAG: dTMP kinase [Patescibacteria group bacterium]
MTRGKFIVFDGGEGSGKSTQVKLLKKYLDIQGIASLLTKEPGGDDAVCKKIRELLLDPAYHGKFSHRAELLLFEADRSQHVDQIIKPALNDGKIVISDRYESATFAYQCGGRGVCTPYEFRFLNNFATDCLQPNFYIYIDIEPAIGLARKSQEGVETRFEKEKLEFHQKVRAGFKEFFAMRFKSRWQEFDGNLSVEELHRQIVDCLKQKQLI